MKKGLFILLLLIITALPAQAAPTNTTGPWGIDAAGFKNLSTALTSPATVGKRVVVTKPMAINNKTISGGRVVHVIKGGSINPAAGKTVTFSAGQAIFEAGDYQAISGAGTVTLDPQQKYLPIWHGKTFLDTLIVGNGGKNITTSPPNPVGFPGDSGVFNGQSNTFIGIGAGVANTSGNINTFVGAQAGRDNTVGDQNVFVGMNAGMSNTTGWHNVFLGAGPGQDNTTGNFNTFVGTDCGLHNITGSLNTYVGTGAAVNGTTGTANVIIGNAAGQANNADNNVFIGQNAGYTNVSGQDGVFIGHQAGIVSTGNANTLVGKAAGWSNTTGYSNTFIGKSAGFNSITGINNTAAGTSSMVSLITGSYNTAVGGGAAAAVQYGSDNIFIGENAGAGGTQLTTVTNSIAIGKGVNTTADNQIVIGNASNNQIKIPAVVTAGTTTRMDERVYGPITDGSVVAMGNAISNCGKIRITAGGYSTYFPFYPTTPGKYSVLSPAGWQVNGNGPYSFVDTYNGNTYSIDFPGSGNLSIQRTAGTASYSVKLLLD